MYHSAYTHDVYTHGHPRSFLSSFLFFLFRPFYTCPAPDSRRTFLSPVFTHFLGRGLRDVLRAPLRVIATCAQMNRTRKNKCAQETSTFRTCLLRLLTEYASQCRIEILRNLSASEPVDHQALIPSLIVATTVSFPRFSSFSLTSFVMLFVDSLESPFYFLL